MVSYLYPNKCPYYNGNNLSTSVDRNSFEKPREHRVADRHLHIDASPFNSPNLTGRKYRYILTAFRSWQPKAPVPLSEQRSANRNQNFSKFDSLPLSATRRTPLDEIRLCGRWKCSRWIWIIDVRYLARGDHRLYGRTQTSPWKRDAADRRKSVRMWSGSGFFVDGESTCNSQKKRIFLKGYQVWMSLWENKACYLLDNW